MGAIRNQIIGNYPDSNQEVLFGSILLVLKKLRWKVSSITENSIIAYSSTSMSSWGEKISITVTQEQNITFSSSSVVYQVYDFNKNKKNLFSFQTSFEQIQSIHSEEEKLACLEEFRKDPRLTNGDTEVQEVNRFYEYFIPSQSYIVTPILLYFNLLIFILMVVSGVSPIMPDETDLLNWGANFAPFTGSGEFYRLFTSMFLHIGFFHLLFNMFALVYVGKILEPLMGSKNFGVVYFCAGLLGSLASFWWNDLTISAGASGAIFGLYGAFLVLLNTKIVSIGMKKTFLSSIALFVLYNLNGFQEGVDHAAHIGGLLMGALSAGVLVIGLKNNRSKQLVFGRSTLIGISVFSMIIVLMSNVKVNTYGQESKEFMALLEAYQLHEDIALNFYELAENNVGEELLIEEIEQNSIIAWRECAYIIEELKALEKSELASKQVELLDTYTQKRLKLMDVVLGYFKSDESEEDYYLNEMEAINLELEEVLSLLQESILN